MKKHFLLFLFSVLLATSSWAQSTTVTLGTDITSSFQNGPVVILGGQSSTQGTVSRHIALYTAAEINATPFAGRAITKIAWYKEDTAQFKGAAASSIKIYLKHTTAANLPGVLGVNWAGELLGATEVYSVQMPIISTGAGWKEFNLPVPFVWDGTSNIEVLVDWFGVGSTFQAADWRYSAYTGTKSATAFGSPAPNMPKSANRPNTRFTVTVFNNDAGVTAITSPTAQVAPNTPVPVQVSLKNFGFNAMTTATLGWKINNVSQPDYTWSGNLANGQSATGITIANRSFPVGPHIIKVYPKTVNNVPDGFAVNDTATFQVVACTPLAGNYTINKNAAASATNFTSFTTVAQLLNSCGISGPVTFTVAPGSGTYNESINLVNIAGTSATNTITFEGNGNTLSSANAAVIKLDRANFVKFNNLVITQTSTATLCYGLQFFGPSDNATVSNCTINMPFVSNSNVIGILLGTGSNSNTPGNYSSNSVFLNNTINGGYYSVRINGLEVTGSTPVGAVNNRFTNNQFRDFNSNGIYMSNANGTKIEGNTFTRPTATSLGNFSGVYLSGGTINTVVEKNRFHNTHGAATSTTSQVTPITVEAAAPAGSENIIKNNLFYNLNNTGNITGISLFSSAGGVYVYNNSFSIENPNRPVSNTSTIKAINLSGAGTNVKFVNNIVTLNMPGTGAKHLIYLAVAPASNFVSNNNVLHLAAGQSNAFTGFLTSNRITLADWQGANTTAPFDGNSVAFNPAYLNLATGNLKPTSPDVNNIGQALTAVTDDFTGATRNTTTPDPGAYEFDLGSNDAGITALISPTSPALPGVALPVQVEVKNLGSATLTATTIGWKVNGVMQPDFSWTGNLAANAVSPVTIGNFTFAAGTHTICAWTKLPNGSPDANAANDSICTTINVCAPLAGNYTIDKNAAASATNFISFSAAAERLQSCGVSGRVRISVVTGTGPYAEQVELKQIPGASATNSVIFQGNGNTLNGTPTAAKTAVVKFDNADFIRINNLNITLTGTGAVSNPTFSAIQLVNNSDNDTISNCTITMPHTGASNAYVVGIFAGAAGASPSGANLDVPGNYSSNSAFLNNTISGGLVGIKLNGNGTGTSGVNQKVIGNVLQDGYNYGISLVNTDGALVQSNEIKRLTHIDAGTFYGISFSGAYKNNTISKNRIHTLWGQFTVLGDAYGFHFSGTGAPAGSENKVINNLYHDNYTPQETYGFYNNGSSGILFYHNTIAVTNSGGFYGYYQASTAVQSVKFNNNLISYAIGNGSLDVFGLYLGTTIETDNNAIYINPNVPNAKFGHFSGTSYNTLPAWKAANATFDQQSVDASPAFKNNSLVDLVPSNPVLNNIGKPLPVVTEDLLGNSRNAATPDPGSYEFTPSTADLAVTAILAPGSGCGLTSQQTVSVTIHNLGSVTATTIPLSFKVDNANAVTETFTGSLPFNGTATYTFVAKANLSAQGAHRVLVTALLPNDSDSSNDTLSVKVTNATQVNLPLSLDFETAATGLASVTTVTKTLSGLTESAAASNGTGSVKGLIMDGIDHANWTLPGGTANAWNMNPDNFAAAYICLSTANTSLSDTLRLEFDLKQLFKLTNANTNFRITVNGTQVGPTYRPPFAGGTPVWQKIKVDLSSYLNLPAIQIGFESNVKEAYANGTGTANLVDNIRIVRIAGPTGVKDLLAGNRIQVYPNPSNGTFNVEVNQAKGFTLTVSDLTGKVLKTQTVKTAEGQVNLDGYPKGIYLLKLVSEGQTATRKLVIQ